MTTWPAQAGRHKVWYDYAVDVVAHKIAAPGMPGLSMHKVVTHVSE